MLLDRVLILALAFALVSCQTTPSTTGPQPTESSNASSSSAVGARMSDSPQPTQVVITSSTSQKSPVADPSAVPSAVSIADPSANPSAVPALAVESPSQSTDTSGYTVPQDIVPPTPQASAPPTPTASTAQKTIIDPAMLAKLRGLLTTPDPMGSMFEPTTPVPDPFFGGFGDFLTPTTSAAGLGGNSFMQMMTMMQLLGGAAADGPDAPNFPLPNTRTARGPLGRGHMMPQPEGATEAMALDNLLAGQEMQLIGGGRPNNQGGRRGGQGSQGGFGSSDPWLSGQGDPRQQPRAVNGRSGIPMPPPTAPQRPAQLNQRIQHPEIMDRRNTPSTSAPSNQGQAAEPVEREAGAAGSQWTGQAKPEPAPQRNQRTWQPPQQQLRPTTTQGWGNQQLFDQYPQTTPSFYPTDQPPFMPQSRQQMMQRHLMERRMRVMNSAPVGNTADARSDHADMLADRADNLASLSPLERMLGGAMGGMSGMGAGGGLGGGGGMGSMMQMAMLSQLFGGGASRGAGGGGGANPLLAMALLGGGGFGMK
ncbi:uncharacterized protein LOC127865505 [Dreissena polymorpha]|uniref:uncharacterized protein LOC127865505 n=1 Tax=Dreissena polymorpha TaxID=45954 RepID=UPI002264F623|nr:uncharacterized protein LOC127865505 [Dreissena polymorpha]